MGDSPSYLHQMYLEWMCVSMRVLTCGELATDKNVQLNKGVESKGVKIG